MVKVGREMINPGGGSLQRDEGEVLLDDKPIVSNGTLELGDVGSTPVNGGEGAGPVTTGGDELEAVGGNELETVGGNEGVVGGNEGVTGGGEGVTAVEESDDDDDDDEGGGDGTTDGEGGTRSSIAQGRKSSCPFTRDF